MAVVAEQQLQRVLAGRQSQRGLCLALAEVHDLLGSREGRAKFGRRVRVNQQVVMPRVVKLDACGGNTHSLQAKLHYKGARDFGTVLRADDVNLSAGRRGRALLGPDNRGRKYERGGDYKHTHGETLHKPRVGRPKGWPHTEA